MERTDAQYYVDFIDTVWQGTIGDNEIQNINEQVEGIANTVFLEIQKCSKGMLAIDITYSLFYEVSSFKDLIINLVSSSVSIPNWIDVLRGNSQYRICVLVASVNWKSAMALALLGLAKEKNNNPEVVCNLKEEGE